MDWWKQGVVLSHRTGDWAVHIFREHKKEADQSAAFGATGRQDEWVYDSFIDWTKVSGICGFWDGSCNEYYCGASMNILLFTPATGWITIFKKCGPVPGNNSLDSELGGCAMLMENLNIWLRKCGKNVLKLMMQMTCCIKYRSTHYWAPLLDLVRTFCNA